MSSSVLWGEGYGDVFSLTRQKNTRSVEYKQSGWKLDVKTKKHLTFTDKKGIGRLKLVGSRDIYFYNESDIKRVRLIRRADGYYCQFCISVDVKQESEPTGKAVGLDVGLKFLYVDNFGHTEENPKFYRQAEKRLKKLQKQVSRKFKKRTAHGEVSSPCGRSKKGQPVSNNYLRAKNRLARLHLKVSRQREEHSKKLARCVVTSNDVVAYEDLQIKNLVKNHHLAKSINDAGWYQLRKWIEYFGVKFGKITIAVPPQWTSQECSNCGNIVKKTLSTLTHQCSCGLTICRDENAARNILKKGLTTVGHTGSWLENSLNALGEDTPTLAQVIVSEQVTS
ncbi:RNA-guided endonuclease TnpB family protein [Chroococcus sp. FPU101]|uniref:RNA-guided endonuclease InsQ/TnpB family protein n=1 Tax=Chroococcus sp. FPU101 TaxID=1974212 RepID=UPI001A8F41CE|nr:RNA-guided endonuclease TnpB family protein [Chroococcus sp. FPU101]GFE69369.1 hypothetical protein CFPU101_19790 [Chroococcus sp. FPU101]